MEIGDSSPTERKGTSDPVSKKSNFDLRNLLKPCDPFCLDDEALTSGAFPYGQKPIECLSIAERIEKRS
ncbi:MAG: hypothetical protein ACXAEI_17020 [Candidatus Hodarchaeales archaeon]